MTLARRVRTFRMWPLADDCPHYTVDDVEDGYEPADGDVLMTYAEYAVTHPGFYEDAGPACMLGPSWVDIFRWSVGDGDWEPVPFTQLAGMTYVVCDRLLDPETNEHCEFDGYLLLDEKRLWRCPGCGGVRYEPEEAEVPA
jgi:hypothetical protein